QVAALLVDDRAPGQRPGVRRCQKGPVPQQIDGAVQVASLIGQARQVIVGPRAAGREFEQHLGGGQSGVGCAGSLVTARSLQQQRLAARRIVVAQHRRERARLQCRRPLQEKVLYLVEVPVLLGKEVSCRRLVAKGQGIQLQRVVAVELLLLGR